MSSRYFVPSPSSLATGSMVPERYIVDSRREETANTFTVALRPARGEGVRAFSPGQFNMLYAFGTGESAISICGSPDQHPLMEHTIRRVGTVTGALDRIAVGDSVGLRGPFGSGWPLEAARGRDLIFVGGGIGLAPLRPAILHALSHRSDYGNIVILVGARSARDMIYNDELLAWKEEPGVELLLTVDSGDQDWHHHVGVVTRLIPMAGFDGANAVGMICGPEVMMRFTAMELSKNGLADENIFVTMERNMKCAVGFCGHCQFGPEFICRDGPVFSFERIRHWLFQREI